MPVDLSSFSNTGFDRGAPVWKEALWILAGAPLLESFLPGSAWRRTLLRLFGSQIGIGVVIKQRVRVKFPWRLSVGAYSWIGEAAWLDNLDWIHIGSHCCISQGAYLGTGNHDWKDTRFGLKTAPIQITDQAWICAHARLAPGSAVGEGAVIAQGAVFSGNAAEWTIFSGNPANAISKRQLRGTD